MSMALAGGHTASDTLVDGLTNVLLPGLSAFHARLLRCRPPAAVYPHLVDAVPAVELQHRGCLLPTKLCP